MKMKNQSSLPSKYWLMIIIVCCIILLGIERFTDGGGPLRFVANYTVIPMQKGISYVGRYISDISDNFQTMEDMKKKNEELQAELDREEVTENTAELLASDDDRWCLALVNEKHPLDTSYVPAKLTEISGGKQVDSRMADSLNKMLDDAKKAGLSMYVTSGYRSYEKQRDVFNTTMQDWINQGYTPLNAYDETKKSVAIPGTSEHATGLAVDIMSTKYGELDEKQGDTEEQKWLMEHCSEYGFVLRFPQDKSDITGIIYEPWHYRYVGVDAAKEMTENGLTLEEYDSAN